MARKPPPKPQEPLTPEEIAAIPEQYAGMMRIFAKRYRKGYEDLSFQDALQAVSLGLMEASRHYCKTRGVKFLSYAKFHVRHQMNAQIHFVMSRGQAKIPHGKQYASIPAPESLYVGDNAGCWGREVDPAVEDPGDGQSFWDAVRFYLSKLEAEVLEARFRDDMDWADVGRLVGRTKEGARQVGFRAMGKLRARIEEGLM